MSEVHEAGYPIFHDPDHYMHLRNKPGLRGHLRRRSEERALRRCLRETRGIASVCDVPCGAGRLFYFWQAMAFRVQGVDLSEEMVAAAAERIAALKLDAGVRLGNAFELGDGLPATFDLIASVRFIYYFERERRVELLRTLAAASRRYVLTQYHTEGTIKGKVNARRKRRDPTRAASRSYTTHREIASEVVDAGLRLIRIAPLSQLSDRAFVLCGKRL